MALPTPSLYQWRTQTLTAKNPAGVDAAYYVPQYSTDSGTTWATLFNLPFQSQVEATQAIAKLVEDEALFASNVAKGLFVLPTMGVTAYP